jgi:hypothetical protein
MQKAEERRVEAEAAKLEAEAAQHIAQAGRLELEAANKARDAAERLAELKRLEAEAARAELHGALAQSRHLRQRAAETKQQVDTEQAASVTLGREAQQERRSAATSQSRIERLRKGGGIVPDEAGVRDALQRYQAAYRTFDFDALTAVYPALPADRRKHLRQWRDACQAYEVMLTDLRLHRSAPDAAMVESQTLYRCVPKAGRRPSDPWGMKENFWLRKDPRGVWIIENITAPPRGG